MTKRCVVMVVLLCACFSVYAQQADLDKLKRLYEDAVLVIETETAQGQSALLAAYTNDLQSLRGKVQKAGELDKLKAILAEISRAQTEQSLPTTLSDVQEMRTLFGVYQQRSQEVKTRRAQRIVALAAQYDKALLRLQQELTRKGELDKATIVQEERKGLEETETLTSALASLAGASEVTPKKTEPQPVRRPSLSAPEIQITPLDVSVTSDIAILRAGERMGNNRAYKFNTIPKELNGLNFVRMECRKSGDYDVRVSGDCLLYALVVTRPTDGSELMKDGWKRTRHTITSDTGDQLLVYEKSLSDGSFRISSTGNWAYMLATKVPITIKESNKAMDSDKK